MAVTLSPQTGHAPLNGGAAEPGVMGGRASNANRASLRVAAVRTARSEGIFLIKAAVMNSLYRSQPLVS